MCTLIAFHRVTTGPDLAHTGTMVAANRDEFYARPARPPERLAPQIVAGVDASQGGTWLGVHAHGLFVGLTNQRGVGGRDPSKRSRGAVVVESLKCGSLSAAVARLQRLDARQYNGFNLMVGDGQDLVVAYARPEVAALELQELGPGIHVLGNDRLHSPDFPKAARIEQEAVAHLARHGGQALEPSVPALRELLASHAQPRLDGVHVPPGQPFPRELLQALEATCIHTPQYGTVSSALLALSPGQLPEFWYADGPPCQHTFHRVPVAEILAD